MTRDTDAARSGQSDSAAVTRRGVVAGVLVSSLTGCLRQLESTTGEEQSTDARGTPGSETASATAEGGTQHTTAANGSPGADASGPPSFTETWTADHEGTEGWGSVQYSDTIAAHDGDLFFGSEGGTVRRFDGAGSVRWERRVNERLRATRLLVAPASSPLVIVGSTVPGLDPSEGRLTALDAETGAVRWEYRTDLGNRILPVLAGGTIFVGFGGDSGFEIASLAVADGSVDWTLTEEGQDEFYGGSYLGFEGGIAPPFGGRLFVNLINTTVAIDPEDGAVRSTHDVYEYRMPGTVVDGHLYTGANSLVRLGPDMTAQWSFEPFDAVTTQPMVTADSVLFGSRDYGVYSVRRNDGSKRWRHRTGGEVYTQPLVTGEYVVAGSSGGSVYLLDRASGEEVSSISLDSAVRNLALRGDDVAVGTANGVHLVAIE